MSEVSTNPWKPVQGPAAESYLWNEVTNEVILISPPSNRDKPGGCICCSRLKLNGYLGDHAASYYCYDCEMAICQNVFEAHNVLTASTHNITRLEDFSAEKKLSSDLPQQQIHNYFNSLVLSLQKRRQQLLNELQAFNQGFRQKQTELEEEKNVLLLKMTSDSHPVHAVALSRVLHELKALAQRVQFTGDDRFANAILSLGRLEDSRKDELRWACPVCTFHNSMNASKCQVCGTLKEKSPVRSKSLPVIPKFQAKFLSSFGHKGSRRGEFDNPTGVGIWQNTREGTTCFVISDRNNNRVVICDKKGSFIRTIGEEKGEKNGQFNSPYFVMVEKDEIFVSDFQNHRIQVLNAENGKWLRTIGKGKGRKKRRATFSSRYGYCGKSIIR
jgi:rubrerythrin